MQKAINRFWDWLFHPGIRWYHYPKGKAAWFRYPSPGSVLQKQPVQDYKTPYEYSSYNIRYKKPVQTLVQDDPGVIIADGAGLKVIDKLKATGLLGVGAYSEDDIDEAKKKFQQVYGYPVEQRVYRNDFNIPIPNENNRESLRQNVQSEFRRIRDDKEKHGNPNIDRRFIQQPHVYDFQSLDMYSDPHFQQTRLEVNYTLDKYANDNAKRGYIEIRKGEKTFWKALDNSNDPQNIERVQASIGDGKPLDFKLENTKIQFQTDKDGNVVDVHPKTKDV